MNFSVILGTNIRNFSVILGMVYIRDEILSIFQYTVQLFAMNFSVILGMVE